MCPVWVCVCGGGQSCNCYQPRPQVADSGTALRYDVSCEISGATLWRISSRGPTAAALSGRGGGRRVAPTAAVKHLQVLGRSCVMANLGRHKSLCTQLGVTSEVPNNCFGGGSSLATWTTVKQLEEATAPAVGCEGGPVMPTRRQSRPDCCARRGQAARRNSLCLLSTTTTGTESGVCHTHIPHFNLHIVKVIIRDRLHIPHWFVFQHHPKPCGDWGVATGTGGGYHWKCLVINQHAGGLGVMAVRS